MKVCVVVLNSIWYDPRVRKQIAEYLRSGVNVCGVGFRCNRYDEKKVAQIPCPVHIVQGENIPRKKLKSVFAKLKRENARNRAVTQAIIAMNPDVIHANDLDTLIPAYRAAKKLKCKLIYDSHEIYVKNNMLVKKPLYALMLGMQERYIVHRVDRMVCVSHAAADYFVKRYHIPKPTVITNCTLKAEQGDHLPQKDGFEVLNHGQFYAGRGYETMIDACELIKDYPEIKLAIRGLGALEKMLREKAAALSNPDQFSIYPPVLVQDLIKEASTSHVGVAITDPFCLNFKLSVSNKLFEYAAAGLPVIMSDIPEHRYLNEKYNFGLILPKNTPEALAEAVIKLYTDKELYDRCVANAKKLSDEVNWENEFGKLITFERSITKE